MAAACNCGFSRRVRSSGIWLIVSAAQTAIGSYPGIGLKEARAKREEAKKLLTSGFDPSLQKRLVKLTSESQKADTFEAITGCADAWDARRFRFRELER
jgi:Arm DNA-binding domain